MLAPIFSPTHIIFDAAFVTIQSSVINPLPH